MQPALWQQLNNLTDYCRLPEKRIRNSQPTNLLRATTCYFDHILIIEAIRNFVGGVGDSSNRINCTSKIDVRETNFKCLCDFCHFFILMTKVATNKKSTSTKEYAIKYLFNTFIVSLMMSFYKETYELSLINTKSSYQSGVPQSPR